MIFNLQSSILSLKRIMSKRVLDVGNCGPDHAAIRSYLKRHFDCEIVQAHGAEDTLQQLKRGRFDLVLVNRKLDADYSDGLEVIRQIKADPGVADVPVMLVTNYPEHQESAIRAGAIRGFGKLEFDKPETRERLAAALGAAKSS
jgi:two-component system chemotaxis response regulator CheY